MKLCSPAFIYFVIAIKKTGLVASFVSLLFVLIWTWFLNFLCKKGYKGISWFLLFLPFLSVLLVMTMGVKAGFNY